MKVLLAARTRWWILAIGWVVLLVLGVTGFVQQSRDLGLDRNIRDHLYFTLQLATLDFRGAPEAINWRLEVARFVAPALAVGTLLQSASVVFREQFARWRVRFADDHTVLTGLDRAGTRLANALVRGGRRVVVVEGEPSAATLAAMRELKVPVVVGDPTDVDNLLAARVDRARHVVVAGPDDATNVAVAAAVGRIGRTPARPPLRCTTRLSNADLAHLLRAADLSTGRTVRVEFFNLHERAARVLVDEHPAPTDRLPHLVVLGLGQFGRAVVVAAAQQWVELGEGPLAVTMVDRAADGRFHGLVARHPALRDAVDARCITTDLEAPGAAAMDELRAAAAAHPPTLVVSAFENQALAWSAGLVLQQMVGDPTPIVVRTESDGGLGKLLGEAIDGSIETFPIFARACTIDTVDGGVREQLARAIHEDHVARAGRVAALHAHWDDLDDHDRESSRAAADAMVAQLASVGCELAPLRHWGDVDTPFTDDEVERLAADEHARWKAERESAGWAWGEVRDDGTRRNPLLVEWRELDEHHRDANRAAVRALPTMLARAGFEIVRN